MSRAVATDFQALPLNCAKLQRALAGMPPLADKPYAPVVVAGLVAVVPGLSAEDILAAWPQNTKNTISHCWWGVLGNLGYAPLVAHHDAETQADDWMCSLRDDGDIWLTRDWKRVWHAQAQAFKDGENLHRSGEWVRLGRIPQPANVTLMELLTRPFRRLGLVLLLSSLLLQALGILVPVFIMVVYDHVIDGRAPVGYTGLLAGLTIVLALELGLRRIRGAMLVKAGVAAEVALSARVTGQLIHLPTALVERASIVSQLGRLRGVEMFRELAVSPLVLGLLDMPFVIISLVMLAFLGGSLVFVPLALMGGYVLMMVCCLPWVKRVLRQQARAHEQQQGLVLEGGQNVMGLRADGLTEVWLERLEREGRQASRAGAASAIQQHTLEVVSLLGSGLAGLLTLCVGIEMVQKGALTPGGLVAAMMLVWRMLAPLSLLCTALPRLVQVGQTFNQLAVFLNLIPETNAVAPEPRGHLSLQPPRGEVELHQVSLRYTRDHIPVFNNLTFTAQEGERVVIMGHNGSGKSSLLKLVMGLYPAQGGNIRLDRVDMRQWDTERLRQYLAYLPQQPELFNDTIASNLRLAYPLASEDELWHVLEQTGAAEVVRQLEDGLEHYWDQAELPEMFSYQLSLSRLMLHPGRLVLCDEIPGQLMAGPLGTSFKTWLADQRGKRTVLVVSNQDDIVLTSDLAIALRPEAAPLVGAPERVRNLWKRQQYASPLLEGNTTFGSHGGLAHVA